MQRAEELVDTWVNGNRKDVVAELAELKAMEVGLMTGFIVHEMWSRVSHDPDEAAGLVEDFLRMVARATE